MLFSKFIVPVLSLFSIASFAFATPVSSASAIVEARAADTTDVTNVLSLVQSLDSTLTNMLNSNQKTSASDMVSQLESTVNGVVTNVKKAKLAQADVHATIAVSINIIVSIIAILGKFSIIDLVLAARVDVFIGAFISSLEVFSPGIGALIGAGIPSVNLGIFVFLRLVISIRILGLGGILGGLLGIIGIIL
ncbi:hypothetical protein EIP91_005890 [Steccherinum ochraceum]|uniref:Uncharacterized protein n=1 Tax=Steccherinum ochraceum TaxID=92696 RepID=A0A4R0R6U0_9APHY|nr:hypothetical protein EIP91_005890 [Steccherinum ochraceum]